MSTDETSPNGKRNFFGNSNRVSGLVLVLIAGFAVYKASGLPFGSIRAPDAGFFPITLSVLLLIVSLIIVARSYIAEPERPQFTSRSWIVAIAAVALVAYALVLQTIGFVVSTIVILLLMMRGFGGMSWLRALVIAVPAVLVSYFGFLQLGVPLPRGLLPF